MVPIFFRLKPFSDFSIFIVQTKLIFGSLNKRKSLKPILPTNSNNNNSSTNNNDNNNSSSNNNNNSSSNNKITGEDSFDLKQFPLDV